MKLHEEVELVAIFELRWFVTAGKKLAEDVHSLLLKSKKFSTAFLLRLVTC
jgi:hypothetical protein